MTEIAINLTEKERQRQHIQQQVDAFLANGGRVNELPCNYEEQTFNHRQVEHDETMISYGFVH